MRAVRRQPHAAPDTQATRNSKMVSLLRDGQTRFWSARGINARLSSPINLNPVEGCRPQHSWKTWWISLAKSSVRQFCSWEYSTNFMKPEVVPSRYRKAPCATSLLSSGQRHSGFHRKFLAFPFWMTTQSPTSYHFTKKVPRVYCPYLWNSKR